MSTSQVIDLFFSFSGRIRRRTWWIATLVLLALEFAIGFAIDPMYYLSIFSERSVRPGLSAVLWSAAVAIPSLAITLKRLNDRNWPVAIAYLTILSVIAILGLEASGAFLPIETASADDDLMLLLSSPPVLFLIWILVDNGFFPGTDGSNRYGPDPRENGTMDSVG